MSIQPMLTTIDEDPGYAAEAEVAQVLNYLQEKAEIRDFYQTTRNSREDAAGIDFVVFATEHWLPLPLQVKRSNNGCKEHRKRHPQIPLIIFKKGDILKQVRSALHEKLSQRKQLLRSHRIDIFNQLTMPSTLETSHTLELGILSHTPHSENIRTRPKLITGYINQYLENKAQSA